MQTERMSELDGLRAIAVGLVVLFHLRVPGFSAGYLGVDLFFVISGFLMTYTMMRERQKLGRFVVSAFFMRRFWRLLPSLALTVLVVLLVAFLLMSPTHFADAAWQSLRAITFSSNHYFYEQAGYFDLANEVRPLLHTWSLSVEEQFYLLFGVFLVLGNRVSFKAVLLSAFFVSLCAAVFVLYNKGLGLEVRAELPFIPVEKYEAAMFYLLPQRLFQFLTGTTIAVLALHTQRIVSPVVGSIVLAVPLICYVLLLLFAGPEWSSFAFTIVLVPLFVRNRVLANFGELGIVKEIARLSYQLYLTHWPIIVFWRYYFGGKPGFVGILIIAVLSIITAWYLYKFSLLRPGKRFGGIAYAFCLPVLVGGVAVGAVSSEGATWRIPNERIYPTIKEMRAEESAYCHGTHLGEDDKDLGAQINGPLITCQNRRPEQPVIYVIGDSHARHLLAGLSETYPAHQISILYFTNCLAQSGFGDYRLAYKGGLAKEENCVARNMAALDFFTKADPATIIIHQYAGHVGDETDVWYEAADILLQKLKATPHRVAWIGSVLRPGTAVSECLNVPRIISDDQLTRRCKGNSDILESVYQKNQTLEGLFPDVYINPNNFFCGGASADACVSFKDGTLLFRDAHHLTVNGSKLFITSLEASLNETVGLQAAR